MQTETRVHSGKTKLGVLVGCWLVMLGMNARAFDQNTISGLKLWLKADAGVTTNGSGAVATWADQSGNTNDVTPATGTAPAWAPRVLYGMPSISFANGGYLHNTTASLVTSGSGRTVFMVGQTPGTTNGFFLQIGTGPNYVNAFYIAPPGIGPPPDGGTYTWTDDAGHNNYISGDLTPVLNTPFYTTFEAADNGLDQLQVYINGVQYTVNNGAIPSGESGAGFMIGNSANGWAGYISEVLVYNSALSPADRQTVETYLKFKYFAPSVYPPVTNGLVLWLNAGFGATVNSNGQVTTWLDGAPGASGSVKSPVSGTAPIWASHAVNGQPGISFTNAGYLLNQTTNLVAAGSARTLFVVGQASASALNQDGYGPYYGGTVIQIRQGNVAGAYINQLIPYDTNSLFTFGCGGIARIGTNALALLTSPFSATFVSPGAGAQPQVYLNGANRFVSWYAGSAIGTESGATPGFYIGVRNDGWGWNGAIAEMLVYNSQLSQADRTNVEAYLKSKYRLPAPPAPPPVTTALRLWLEADAGVEIGNGFVVGWADQSGNQNSVQKNNDYGASAASAVNGRPALSFANGSLDNTATNLVASGSPRTVFVVGQAASGVNGYFLQIRLGTPGEYVNAFYYAGSGNVFTWTDNNGANNHISGDAEAVLTSPFYATLAANANASEQMQVYINGKNYPVSGDKPSAENNANTGFRIGGGTDANLGWNGYIAAMLVYESVLSDPDRARVEHYLGLKYGLVQPAGSFLMIH